MLASSEQREGRGTKGEVTRDRELLERVVKSTGGGQVKMS
jgi:hypothetical protein